MPVLFNGVIVGAVVHFCYSPAIPPCRCASASVAAGEAVACLVVGPLLLIARAAPRARLRAELNPFSSDKAARSAVLCMHRGRILPESIFICQEVLFMRIALINENSQAAKNVAIEAALKKVVTPMGHQVDNYGMYGKEGESQLTYVQTEFRRDFAQLRRGGLRRHRMRHGRRRDAGAQQLPGRALRPRGRSLRRLHVRPDQRRQRGIHAVSGQRASAGGR